MLSSLKITGFAIIREAEITFSDGLNVLTGETGAGKSIVVDAISLVAGGRGKTEDIRSGDDEAAIEAVFSTGNLLGVKESLDAAGIDYNGGELIVRRVISRSGRNRIQINGSSATQACLFEIMQKVVDICAQNENRLLMNREAHVNLLDEYGELGKLRTTYLELFEKLRRVIAEKDELTERKRTASEKADYLRFVVREISELKLKPGEDDELRGLKKKLSNLGKIRDIANSCYETVYSGEGALVDRLKAVTKDFHSIRDLDPSFGQTTDEIDGFASRLSDIAFDLKGYIDGLDFDDGTLAETEERLDRILAVTRKYGSIDEAIARSTSAYEELRLIDNFDAEISAIESEETRLRAALKQAAEELSRTRKKKAKSLDEEINRELAGLSMEGAKFLTKIDPLPADPNRKDTVRIDGGGYSKNGSDEVEFFISANVGEDLKPLIHVASLGELSRIMLALKGVLFGMKKTGGTYIFDEIDTGIGGKVAEMVGKRLKRFASKKQVICVTHLSQIASFADVHLKIEKELSKGRTLFKAAVLTEGQRCEELARMLAGEKITDRTRALAKELMEKSLER